MKMILIFLALTSLAFSGKNRVGKWKSDTALSVSKVEIFDSRGKTVVMDDSLQHFVDIEILTPYSFKAYEYSRSSIRGICEWKVEGNSHNVKDTLFLTGMSVGLSQTEYDIPLTCQNYWNYILCKKKKTLRQCGEGKSKLVFKKQK